MEKTATINMRVNAGVKKDAEAVYSHLGLTLTDAINMFLYKSIMEGGLPFDAKISPYNYETLKAMEEARDITSGKVAAKRYSSAQEMFADIDAEG